MLAQSFTQVPSNNGVSRGDFPRLHDEMQRAIELNTGVKELSPKDHILMVHKMFSGPLSFDYARIAKSAGQDKANKRLKAFDYRLKLGGKDGGLLLTIADDEIKNWADAMAYRARRLIARNDNRSIYYQLEALREMVTGSGLEYPLPNTPALKPCLNQIFESINRAQSEKWWRRAVRVAQARAIEAVARDLRLVSLKTGIYASNHTVKRRAEQKSRNRYILENTEAENEAGQVYTLAELSDLSVSNPTNRRNELMTRIAGFEVVAKQLNHVAVFYTITAPSRCHAIHHSGAVNSLYDGSTPRDAQQHLTTVWARTRAALAREKLEIYGFRVAEPHHDGTPHWHLLLFMPAKNEKRVSELLNFYAIEGTEPTDKHEKGAQKQRCVVIQIDPKRGNAAGYIAKYIAKNVDGANIGADLYGKCAVDSAVRIEAWASTWGIRQFQQIGGPSVTIWRLLRALKIEELLEIENDVAALNGPNFPSNRIVASDELTRIHAAADQADWAGFVMLMGGPVMRRNERPLRTWSQCELALDGENVFFDFDNIDFIKTGASCDPLAGLLSATSMGAMKFTKRGVVSVNYGINNFKTRFRRWVVRPVMGVLAEAKPPPWSSVNNCTQSNFTNEYLTIQGN
jgi:hypothetical protein